MGNSYSILKYVKTGERVVLPFLDLQNSIPNVVAIFTTVLADFGDF